MLEITELRKAYGANQVLRDVGLTATAGQIVGLLVYGVDGRSGTTVSRVVNVRIGG